MSNGLEKVQTKNLITLLKNSREMTRIYLEELNKRGFSLHFENLDGRNPLVRLDMPPIKITKTQTTVEEYEA